MNVNKTQLVLIAVIVALAGALVYQHIDSDSNASSDSKDTAETTEGGGSGTNREVPSTVSDSLSVNNPAWGHIQIVSDSYDGRSVTYQAVPESGCSFMAWLDSNQRFIELSDKITSSQLDPKGTVAQFTDQAGDASKTSTYAWRMPTFETDEKGNMKYTGLTYTSTIPESEYQAYRDSDVHREAVLGNVYLTPWELVADDPAVQDATEYLRPYIEGMSNMRVAWIVMSFVQDIITYQTDSAQYGHSEYWAYPVETIYSGKGDCEDTAVLFCAIGSKLGLDTGLVSFSYSDTARKNLGHMGAAFALEGDENVAGDNNPVFTYMNKRYCYVETATDSRLDLGYLLKYPDVSAYLIEDGGFTHITYSEENGFGHEVLVSIGTSYDTNSPVRFDVNIDEELPNYTYGDDFTNPPTITMAVGDSFSYIPATNLPCTFSASGDGLVDEGGPFSFNGETFELSGKVTDSGTYHVVIKAETTGLEVYQVAYQYITFVVGESDVPNYGGQAKSLSFINGSWNIESIDVPAYSADGQSEEPSEGGISGWMVVGVAAFAFILLLAIMRFII